ncbi:MAG: tRNA (guanosine(37)-N1)-methyltransferase TrmD [Candidatus Staskawiczbacteria bacterium RIFOXYC1_FULL_37_43]|nr:MAG: tRNA (guanosine(37)-N1)-methyltransferase TrmD [Candidatus Staskawiczbacteria bacterium RIFCSPHIGHO2_01_FULL_37_17]OGZ72184.1 MAG: tRNA (guanosine(37)-N1)-methyltransferase TrmD [Candidatus Staskawiczbacteria bacterium RIFCSPLOWO2_01_FULL_37_19]OGZ75532.1 MAG: tRNA (guanosine(37)-N1)-methyltransferase TrmD [Candidatus Staskawiczbacteria bacterium RIFOXYA1_FULL_37_15]OGZ77757.1 MAG: tRNA (guanosine(37)-N1)-methyltransferase TrmD [Candidatus Staskawiczbacteria bacterium RIFOXYA12_FULL_37_1
MIKFDIITIFPEIFKSYLGESLIARAQKKKLIKINIHNLRKWTNDSHKTVDDRPFGGGLGMVLKVEPIFKAVKQIKKSPAAAGSRYGGTKVILFTPRGKKFDQKLANKLSKLDQIIFICGRYEGVDERVAKKIADMEISIGDYDLMGGELPAMVAIETISRLIPGVLGKPQLLKERITKSGGFIEYAQYTRPPKFFVNLPKFQKKFRGAKKFRRAKPEVWSVPRVLLSGDHKKIEEWKKKHNKIIE